MCPNFEKFSSTKVESCQLSVPSSARGARNRPIALSSRARDANICLCAQLAVVREAGACPTLSRLSDCCRYGIFRRQSRLPAGGPVDFQGSLFCPVAGGGDLGQGTKRRRQVLTLAHLRAAAAPGRGTDHLAGRRYFRRIGELRRGL